jgi:predicted Zn-dependent protease
MNRLWLWGTAALMAAGMGLTALAPMDRAATFTVMAEAWMDVWQDAGQSAGRLTRMSAAREIALGEEFARQVEAGAVMPAEATAYVSAVGRRLVKHAQRQDLRWRFRVIDAPVMNAFALPGGSIYVYRGLLDELRDEAQLAALLGHEIAHADLYHCADRFQPGGLVAMAYSQGQERDADELGFALAVKAGYDPGGAARLMALFLSLTPPPAGLERRSKVGEVAGAAVDALGDYFRSHPRSAERASRLRALRDAAPKGGCVGEENLRRRTPCPESAGAR